MNLAEFFSQGLSLVGTFNPKIVAFLFLLCLIGEAVGLSVPYLLETTWLMVGYQFSARVLPFFDLMLLVLMAQVGRQGGALALYGMSRTGSGLLTKYKNRFKFKTGTNFALLRLFRKINLLSPFSVALGRLLWLRIPLTLALGARRKLKVLLLGTVLSSLVYDGTYISVGAIVGTTTKLEPIRILLYFLAGLTVIYIATFAIRRLIGSLAQQRHAKRSIPEAASDSVSSQCLFARGKGSPTQEAGQ
jgi:membrane-associated protein